MKKAKSLPGLVGSSGESKSRYDFSLISIKEGKRKRKRKNQKKKIEIPQIKQIKEDTPQMTPLMSPNRTLETIIENSTEHRPQFTSGKILKDKIKASPAPTSHDQQWLNSLRDGQPLIVLEKIEEKPTGRFNSVGDVPPMKQSAEDLKNKQFLTQVKNLRVQNAKYMARHHSIVSLPFANARYKLMSKAASLDQLGSSLSLNKEEKAPSVADGGRPSQQPRNLKLNWQKQPSLTDSGLNLVDPITKQANASVLDSSKHLLPNLASSSAPDLRPRAGTYYPPAAGASSRQFERQSPENQEFIRQLQERTQQDIAFARLYQEALAEEREQVSSLANSFIEVQKPFKVPEPPLHPAAATKTKKQFWIKDSGEPIERDQTFKSQLMKEVTDLKSLLGKHLPEPKNATAIPVVKKKTFIPLSRRPTVVHHHHSALSSLSASKQRIEVKVEDTELTREDTKLTEPSAAQEKKQLEPSSSSVQFIRAAKEVNPVSFIKVSEEHSSQKESLRKHRDKEIIESLTSSQRIIANKLPSDSMSSEFDINNVPDSSSKTSSKGDKLKFKLKNIEVIGPSPREQPMLSRNINEDLPIENLDTLKIHAMKRKAPEKQNSRKESQPSKFEFDDSSLHYNQSIKGAAEGDVPSSIISLRGNRHDRLDFILNIKKQPDLKRVDTGPSHIPQDKPGSSRPLQQEIKKKVKLSLNPVFQLQPISQPRFQTERKNVRWKTSPQVQNQTERSQMDHLSVPKSSGRQQLSPPSPEQAKKQEDPSSSTFKSMSIPSTSKIDLHKKEFKRWEFKGPKHLALDSVDIIPESQGGTDGRSRYSPQGSRRSSTSNAGSQQLTARRSSIFQIQNPILREQMVIQYEIDELKQDFEQAYGFSANQFIKQIQPYIGVDLSVGLVWKKKEVSSKKRKATTSNRSSMMKGLVQRISSKNKIEIKQQLHKKRQEQEAKEQERFLANQDPKDRQLLIAPYSSRPISSLSSNLKSPASMVAAAREQKFKQLSSIFNQVAAKHGRALRVLIDAHKDKVYKQQQEKLKREKDKTSKEKTMELLQNLNDMQKKEMKDSIMGVDNEVMNKRAKLEYSIISQMIKNSENSEDVQVSVRGSTKKDDRKMARKVIKDQYLSLDRMRGPKLQRQNLRLQRLEKLEFDQRSLAVSQGNTSVSPSLLDEINHVKEKQEGLRRKQTTREIKNSIIIKSLVKQSEALQEKMNKRLFDFTKIIPKPPKPQKPKQKEHGSPGGKKQQPRKWNLSHSSMESLSHSEASVQKTKVRNQIDEIADISEFSSSMTLKYFMKYVRQQFLDYAQLVAFDKFKMENEELGFMSERVDFFNQQKQDQEMNFSFYKQFLQYMKKNKFKIERFVEREAIKLQMLKNAEEDSDNEFQGKSFAKEMMEHDFMKNQKDYLLIKDDLPALKHSSYMAEDFQIDNLPLCQLYIFREQIARQMFIKQKEMLLTESYLFESSMEDDLSIDESFRKKIRSNTLATMDPKSKFMKSGMPTYEQGSSSKPQPESRSDLKRTLDEVKVDYEMMDIVMKKLKFFKSFEKQTRFKLYKELHYEYFCKNQLIFEDDKNLMQKIESMAEESKLQNAKRFGLGLSLFDQENHYQILNQQKPHYDKNSFKQKIFVIVSGHASLICEEWDKKLKFVRRTLFPGDSVGDGPLSFDIQSGQNFSLLTTTDCDIISIEKNIFKEILVKDFTNISDLKDKMKSLKNQLIFSNVTNYSLMILSKSLQIKTFHYGDVILSQDDTPKYFYIMLDGRCKTNFEAVVIKNKKQYLEQQPQRGELRQDSNSTTTGKRLLTGPIDYKKFVEPPHFVRKQRAQIQEAAFLGNYKYNKHRTQNKAIIDLSGAELNGEVVSVSGEGFSQFVTIHGPDGIHQRIILNCNQTYSKVIGIKKPPLPPISAAKKESKKESKGKEPATGYVGIKKQVQYTDSRVIISREGDKSTFDDFDWGEDIMDKSGFGSSFCQRVLLQEEPLRKQIRKYYDFYLNLVGGMEKVGPILEKRQMKQLIEHREPSSDSSSIIDAKEINESQKKKTLQISYDRDTLDLNQRASSFVLHEAPESKNPPSSPQKTAKTKLKPTIFRDTSPQTMDPSRRIESRQTIRSPAFLKRLEFDKKPIKKTVSILEKIKKTNLQDLVPTPSRTMKAPFKFKLHETQRITGQARQAQQKQVEKEDTDRQPDLVEPLPHEGGPARRLSKMEKADAKVLPLTRDELCGPINSKLFKHQQRERKSASPNQRSPAQKPSMSQFETVKPLRRATLLQDQLKTMISTQLDRLKPGQKVSSSSVSNSDNTNLMSKLMNKRQIPSNEGSPWNPMEKKKTRNPFSKSQLRSSTFGEQNLSGSGPPKNLQTSSSSSLREVSSDEDVKAPVFKIRPLVTPSHDGKVKTAGIQQPSKPSLKIRPLQEASKSSKRVAIFEDEKHTIKSSPSKVTENEKSDEFDPFEYDQYTSNPYKNYIRKRKGSIMDPKGDSFKQFQLEKKSFMEKIDIEDGAPKAKTSTASIKAVPRKSEVEQVKELKEQIILELLMRSQVSVVATSSKVRVICMPADSLNYLSEPMRRQIREKILSLFIPMPKDEDEQAKKKPESGRSQTTKPSEDEPIPQPQQQENDAMMVATDAEIEKDMSNRLIAPQRYNYIDLVDRPFCTEKALQNFIRSNQEWTEIKDVIYKRSIIQNN